MDYLGLLPTGLETNHHNRKTVGNQWGQWLPGKEQELTNTFPSQSRQVKRCVKQTQYNKKMRVDFWTFEHIETWIFTLRKYCAIWLLPIRFTVSRELSCLCCFVFKIGVGEEEKCGRCMTSSSHLCTCFGCLSVRSVGEATLKTLLATNYFTLKKVELLQIYTRQKVTRFQVGQDYSQLLK